MPDQNWYAKNRVQSLDGKKRYSQTERGKEVNRRAGTYRLRNHRDTQLVKRHIPAQLDLLDGDKP